VAKPVPNSRLLLRAWIIVALLCTFARAQQPARTNASEDNLQLSAILERMQKAQADPRPATPYQVIRDYRLVGEKASDPGSEVVAEVDSISPEEKSFVIQKRVGSSRAEDVVRKILQHETQLSTPEQQSEAAINTQNYAITYLGAATLNGSSCYLLGLEPRRKDTELIHGRVWVDPHSFQIRHIEGELAKSPSWMVKKVALKVDFADVRGVWLQTGMEAVADVRFVGTQTLRSQTIDTRVGDLVAQNMSINKRSKDSKRKARNIPAVAIAPVDRSQ
jgi:hypothetical protein